MGRCASPSLAGKSRDGYMPLEEFADQAIRLWQAQPTPEEINVERVRFLRFAERNEQVTEALELLGSL